MGMTSPMTSTLPRVTEILRRTGLATYPTYPAFSDAERAWYMARGNALHHAIALDAAGELDEDALHPEISGAFSAYRKFCADTQHVAWESELEIVSERHGFQGHLDRVGLVMDIPSVIDWKMSASVDTRTVTLQLAGYEILYAEVALPVHVARQSLVVLLRPDGTYRVQPVRAQEHRITFFSALAVYRALTAWSDL